MDHGPIAGLRQRKFHPIVRGEAEQIAWAIREDSPLLPAMLDKFADTHKLGTTFGNMLKKRYLSNQSPVPRATSEEERQKFAHLVTLFSTTLTN